MSFVSHIGTLCLVVCLAALLFLLAHLHKKVGSPARSFHPCLTYLHPLAALSCLLSTPTTCLCLPYHLDECLFNSLVVGFPCKCFSGSSGCSLFLNWLLFFFWLCEEVKYFCLCLHPGWNSRTLTLISSLEQQDVTFPLLKRIAVDESQLRLWLQRKWWKDNFSPGPKF